MPLPIRIELASEQKEAASRRVALVFGDRVKISGDARATVGARLVALEDLPSLPNEPVMVIGNIELRHIVPLMRARSWFNHVVNPRAFEDETSGAVFAGALWKLLARGGRSQFFCKDFAGRNFNLRDSDKREERIDTIAAFAARAKLSSTVIARVRDVAEELITNALYDAPAERIGRPADRTRRVVLEKNQACSITYGVSRQTFFIRVRDPFGSLKRQRLIEVLARCSADDEVGLDQTRGGAGLGMWRIFHTAQLVVIQVRSGVSTEFLIGIDAQRGRRSTTGKTIHLFFDEREPDQAHHEVVVQS